MCSWKGKHLCWSLFLIALQVAGRNFICERLPLFASPQNTIANSSGEFGLDETSTECKGCIFLKRTEVVAQKCSVKKVFLEISQNSLEKQVCQSLFFNKVAGLRPEPLLKKRPWHWCFPVNFANFLRTPFLTKQLQWLLLRIV